MKEKFSFRTFFNNVEYEKVKWIFYSAKKLEDEFDDISCDLWEKRKFTIF